MEQQLHTQLFLKTPGDCATHSQAQQFLSLGDLMGWQTQVIGQAPMLKEAVRIQDWLLVPAHEDTTPLPPRTMRRIKIIYSQGLRPQGFVVVHEAPMLLTSPKKSNPNPSEMAERLSSVLPGLGKASTLLALGLGILLLGSMLLPMGLLAGVAMVDPILVAVTENGYWIEIDRWQS